MVIDLRLKYDCNSVPILSNEDIEHHVDLILSDYNPLLLSKPQPLDIEDFAENYLELGMHFHDLSHNGCIWGRMVFNNAKIIVYNRENNCAEEEPIDANTIVIDNSLLTDSMETVFRSTVAHECGHSVYHEEYYYVDFYQLPYLEKCDLQHMPYTTCFGKTIRSGIPRSRQFYSPIDTLEHQAKYFSASILMPRKSMRELCLSDSVQRFCFDKYCGYENDALISIISKTYNVSFQSAKIRLKTLGLALISKSAQPDSFFASNNYHAIPRF